MKIVLISFLLIGCGVRGPLVPPKKPISIFELEAQTEATKSNTKNEKKDDKKNGNQ